MNSLDEGPLTLAALRRKRGGRKTRDPRPAKTPGGLFDLFAADGNDLSPAQLSSTPFHTAEAEPIPTVFRKPESQCSPATFSTPPTSNAPASPEIFGVATPTSPREPEAARASVAQQVWTVSALVQQVRAIVEGSYRTVSVEGEISNWRPAGSGHCYFTLKDGSAQLSVVLFRKQAALLRFRPKDGDTVRLRGQLSVYESRGQMQLIGESMEQVGLGALLQATRELKERLRREGLFDRKRPLPAFPRCIGVITSTGGAALRDIVKVCRRRHAAVNLLVYPVAVQGAGCAMQVEAGLRWFSQHPERADVVLVARGGGSWEDLHGFDHERVARAIVACSLPVITGIGHATDTTVADAAADVCAPTPSAAAELLTAAQHRVEEQVARLGARLVRATQYEMLRTRQRLAAASTDRMLRRAEVSLGQRTQRLEELTSRLREATRGGTARSSIRLAVASAHLRERSPRLRLAGLRERAVKAEDGLRRRGAGIAESRRIKVERAVDGLQALSPLRVLERGYALVYGPDGHLLRSAATVEPGEAVIARLAEGSLRARVEAKG